MVLYRLESGEEVILERYDGTSGHFSQVVEGLLTIVSTLVWGFGDVGAKPVYDMIAKFHFVCRSWQHAIYEKNRTICIIAFTVFVLINFLYTYRVRVEINRRIVFNP